MRAPNRCTTGAALARPSWVLGYLSATGHLLTASVMRMLATAFASPGSPAPARPGSRVNRRSGRSARLTRSAAVAVTAIEPVSGAGWPAASRHAYRLYLVGGPSNS